MGHPPKTPYWLLFRNRPPNPIALCTLRTLKRPTNTNGQNYWSEAPWVEGGLHCSASTELVFNCACDKPSFLPAKNSLWEKSSKIHANFSYPPKPFILSLHFCLESAILNHLHSSTAWPSLLFPLLPASNRYAQCRSRYTTVTVPKLKPQIASKA